MKMPDTSGEPKTMSVNPVPPNGNPINACLVVKDARQAMEF